MKLRWPSLRRPAKMSSQPAEQEPPVQQLDETNSDDHSCAPIISPAMPPLRKPRLHRLSQDSRVVPADDDEAALHDACYLDRLAAEAAAHEKVVCCNLITRDARP